MSRNLTYAETGSYEFTSKETPEDTLNATRAKALELAKHGDMMLRSCWVCNGAHVHLIEVNNVVLNCFVCGHFYLSGVDVTELP